MYLFIDCETGGLPESTSLLEVGFISTDKKFNIIFENVWKIKPNDNNYIVTAQGLSVNGINLIEHDKIAISYKDAGTRLYNNLSVLTEKGKNKLIPVGKNIAFDCQRIFQYLISKETWEQFCSYQPLELNVAWRLLELQGKVPILPKSSLSDLCNHFNIPVESLHSSLGDCRLYVELLKRMLQL